MTTVSESRPQILPGKLRIIEHFFKVPLDYSQPSSDHLDIFARSVTRHESPIAPLENQAETSNPRPRPWIIYLQGGPGKPCPLPQSSPLTPILLDRGYQILYLDQRGTGLSSPISAATLKLKGDAQAQANYLKCFRADNIVRDCEAVRHLLTRDYPERLWKWSVWGQSFGGYCAVAYVSMYPEGLREVFLTAGVPPLGMGPEDVYARTFARMRGRNRTYYGKFPEDVGRVHELVDWLESSGGVQLPAGGTLTAQRLMTMGTGFGAHGSLDVVHDLVLRMHTELESFGFVARPTLAKVEAVGGYDDAVIYAVLREAIYCSGQASNWSAERVGKTFAEFGWISGFAPSTERARDQPLYFSGGMVFPFMFEIHPELRKVKDVADILAQYTWPRLYDEARLACNEVPIYAAVFVDDAYIDFELSQRALKTVRGCKQFVTNTMYHDAVRSKTRNVTDALFRLRDDVLD
ncbi:MAG: hypothetical protein MMC23_000589 [Stictis urceolatum]|nr:hypothetical protein [Stictis urceolata]